MKQILTLKAKVLRVLKVDYKALTLILGVSALLLAVGFTINDKYNPQYTSLLTLAPMPFWVLSFFAYGILKIVSCFIERVLKVEILLSMFGLWLWTYIVLSFIVFDRVVTAPTDLILLVTLLCESWVLAIIFYNTKISGS